MPDETPNVTDAAPAEVGANPESETTDETPDTQEEDSPEHGPEPTTEAPAEEGEAEGVEAAETEEESSDDQPPDDSWLEAGLDQEEEQAADNSDDFEFFELESSAATDEDRRRFREQQEGVKKLKNRVEQERAQYASYQELDRQLATPESAAEAITNLVNGLRNHYGERFQLSLGQPDTPQEERNWWEMGDDDEPQQAAELSPSQVQAALAQIGLDADTVKYLSENAKGQQAEAARARAASDAFPEVTRKLQSEYPGFKVTLDELKSAMAKHPGYAPFDAIMVSNRVALKKHVAGLVRGGKKMPNMPKGTQGKSAAQDNSLDAVRNGFTF